MRLAPSSGSRAASCASSWPPRRSSWASTSARSTWCARSARRARIATFLQRVGRSGHALGGHAEGTPLRAHARRAGRGAALVRAVRAGRLDALVVPEQPLDILAQQIVADVRRRGLGRGRAVRAVRRAWPYRDLDARRLRRRPRDAVRGRRDRRGRAPAHLHRDRVNRRVRGRRAPASPRSPRGGAIPDTADYDVVAEPEGTRVGTVDEDFAIESMAGDIFLLGNTSWRIRRVEAGKVRVEDAQGQPPTIPFWLGEAPGRTVELSRGGLAPARGDRSRASPTARGRDALARASTCGLAPALAPRRSSSYRRGDARDARRRADAAHGRRRALLRRGGRHAARRPRALRRAHQPRLGPGAAQALLPHLRLRAAGRRHRRRHRPVARAAAQLPAGDDLRTSCTVDRRARC